MPEPAVNALMHVVAAFTAATVALVAIDLLWLSVTARVPGRRGGERMLKAGVGLVVSGLLATGLLLLAINPTAPVEAAARPLSQQHSPPAVVAASAPPT